MAKVEVGERRSRINELSNGLEVVIPAKKNYYIIVFISIWLVAWLFVLKSAFYSLTSPESHAPMIPMVIWTIGWTIGGIFAILMWIWNFKGKEIITFNGIELKHKRDFFLFSRSKEYEMSHIKGLRVTPPPSTSRFGLNNGFDFGGYNTGTITFDYGNGTHRVGGGIDEAEAEYIVEAIKRRYKSL